MSGTERSWPPGARRAPSPPPAGWERPPTGGPPRRRGAGSEWGENGWGDFKGEEDRLLRNLFIEPVSDGEGETLRSRRAGSAWSANPPPVHFHLLAVLCPFGRRLVPCTGQPAPSRADRSTAGRSPGRAFREGRVQARSETASASTFGVDSVSGTVLNSLEVFSNPSDNFTKLL